MPRRATCCGRTRWTTLPGARITGAPTLYQDRLYVPVASSEEGDRAQSGVSLLQVPRQPRRPGSQRQRGLEDVHAVGEREAAGKTSAGTERWGPSGAGIWSAPTIDAARKLVYVSTGNMYTEPQQITSDAVIAMDLDTGKIRWVSQRLPKDVWIVGCPPAGNNCAANAADIGPDYDLGDSPMLAKLPNGKDAIVVGQKSGQGWALDPDKKGAVLWEYRAGRGTTLGGIEWGPAVDAQNAYFAVSDFTSRESRRPACGEPGHRTAGVDDARAAARLQRPGAGLRRRAIGRGHRDSRRRVLGLGRRRAARATRRRTGRSCGRSTRTASFRR